MDNVFALMVSCNSNPDYDGVWTKKETQAECKELGIPVDDWMPYALDHLFIDESAWTSKVADVFVNNDSILSMTIELDGDMVTLTKRIG